MIRLRLIIHGRVQGVGFRPAIYRAAKKSGIRGWIKNTPSGVFLEVEGKTNTVNYLIKNLKNIAPVQAVIKNISIKKLPLKGFASFKILQSTISGKNYTLIPPDISICNPCKKELFTVSNRRFLYPFINCTNCGPRFSIIYDIPYDRVNTTMSDFKMCPRCQKEFNDPLTRRFHAQPNACAACGPKMLLTDKSGKMINCSDPVNKTIDLLKKGKIIAIKGIGGFHLCCDAMNKQAVLKLRKRKNRPDKPFAIMAPDIKAVRKLCFINKEEQKILLSPERPILLLQKKTETEIYKDVAPANKYLGVMLPYSPLHHLLFYPSKANNFHALIMTSGNISNEPISRNNDDAYQNLGEIADYFLIHNREIFNRCDDSIAHYAGKSIRVLRRARGYVPNAFDIYPTLKNKEIFAAGADMKSSFALFTKGRAFLSQYIGELNDKSTLEFFEEAFSRMADLTGAKPKTVLHDLHPNYLSTIFAKQFALKNLLEPSGIQHHQAHVASVAAEKNLKLPFIGVAFDGTGYGLDGNIWGGEFFAFTKDKILRSAHLDYFPLPGGDTTVKEIWRTAYALTDYRNIDFIDKNNISKLKIVKKMAETNINSPLTSSMGRFFDAAACLLGLRNETTYEAQAAIELESLCRNKPKEYYPVDLKKINSAHLFDSTEKIIIGQKQILSCILDDKKKGTVIEKIAEKFHLTIVKLISEIGEILAQTYGTDKILLSGGVFQNKVLTDWLTEEFKKKHLNIYFNTLVPSNDGGISLGQIWIYLNYIAKGY
ncbi:MAG: carbamoyltransferase HypF [bacterium]|nr:carbamoyltransferase HypF [bacterium]